VSTAPGEAKARGRPPLARPVTFGLSDGLVCYLGVVLGLLAHPALILPVAIGVGAAETVGMAAGEWLSESKNGFAASLAIGLATGAGAVIPALPFAVMPGWYARAWSIGLVLVVTGVIAWTRYRTGERSLVVAAAETYGTLAAAAVVVAICVHVTPGGAA
jgi:VIT1/CCC1 family predicted Fe2+/Mn2+ transporter